MRRITGLTQPEYARLVGVAPRALIDVERGVANPTLETLEKIGRSFGLRVGLVVAGGGSEPGIGGGAARG